MILGDREIAAAIERGSIRISPYPAPEAWSSTAIDLTLDAPIHRWKVPPGPASAVVGPAGSSFASATFAAENMETHDLSSTAFELPPLQLVLGWTVERIQLPHRSRLAARVEGKSSLARLGLGVHVTAPTIHAGFGYSEEEPDKIGLQLQLEIFNVGPFRIRLERGMRICQLIFEEVHGTPQKGYTGMFAHQGRRMPEVGKGKDDPGPKPETS
jgi:dCTP deaminase